jgi:hypothetical protein
MSIDLFHKIHPPMRVTEFLLYKTAPKQLKIGGVKEKPQRKFFGAFFFKTGDDWQMERPRRG